MLYQDFNNKVAILPKRELTVDFPEKPPWWKIISRKVYSLSFSISLKTDSSAEVFFQWFYKIAPSKISENFIWDFFAIPLLTKLQAFNLKTSFLKKRCLIKINKQLLVSKTSWRSLEDFVNVAISDFSRPLENILENEKLLWLRKNLFVIRAKKK